MHQGARVSPADCWSFWPVLDLVSEKNSGACNQCASESLCQGGLMPSPHPEGSTGRTGTHDHEMLKYKGERTSEGWYYLSGRAIALDRVKKNNRSDSVVSQTLNIYQMCENMKLDRSQPTPSRVSEGKKNMTVAFCAWSQNLISSFHFPLLPQQHWTEWACR